tara:strand:- start:101 stop:505 length:405 start_codon:yes stop_codon:yes gene_type:complete
MGPEAKLYQKFKKATPKILWNRIENLTVPGMPDALCYNKRNVFFTVEFKVTQGIKLKFSPHQLAWHQTHPENTFIIAEALGPRSSKTSSVFLYPGSRIMELDACGLKLDASAVGLDACCSELEACGLTLETMSD